MRYCARPAFALQRLREIDSEHLVYESIKPGPGGSVSLMLTPLDLIERLAALILPPRRHRHLYYGVLAPNASLKAEARFRRSSRRPNTGVFDQLTVGYWLAAA
ncbi:transposase [Accumulibacter sp.]|uniref:transposase n=1 Tax=Accumulibacter sp. TaxID=2053492 RepID=UPI00262A756A|nr:transposase [Accumulibacter sp.]